MSFVTICADLDDPHTFEVEVWQGSPSYRFVRRVVFGQPQQLTTVETVSLWVNAHGKQFKLNPNPIAQQIWQRFGGPTLTGVADWRHELLGNMVVCGPLGMGSSVPRELIDEIKLLGEDE